MNFTITKVWKENRGWDIEARRDSLTLRLEVKGTEGKDIAAELTPNEFTNCSHEHYRICVVTDALVRPTLHIFAKNSKGHWYNEDGRLRLQLLPRTAARLSVSNA